MRAFLNLFGVTYYQIKKQIKLEKINTSKTLLKYSYTYDIQNDTILDEIISIEKYNSKQYKKVYDLTVPKTKNFGCEIKDFNDFGLILNVKSI